MKGLVSGLQQARLIPWWYSLVAFQYLFSIVFVENMMKQKFSGFGRAFWATLFLLLIGSAGIAQTRYCPQLEADYSGNRFKILLGEYQEDPPKKDLKKWESLFGDCLEIYQDDEGVCRYLVGEFKTGQSARRFINNELKKKGIKTAKSNLYTAKMEQHSGWNEWIPYGKRIN